MSNLLLSICVPTYNRASLLKNCLDSLTSQITNDLEDLIEIFVTDNASTDHTDSIIRQFANIKSLIYRRSEVNEGMDSNFLNCFKYSKGKFLWIFSDDDCLTPDSLKKVVELLIGNSNCGVCYLNSSWKEDVSYSNQTELKTLTPEVIISKSKFIEKVSYWITFLTGNIVNKTLVENVVSTSENMGTFLVQLSWVVPAIYKSDYNIYIPECVVVCKIENTGGYKLFQVFAANFNLILDRMIARRIMNKAHKVRINNKMLLDFFPQFIENSSKFESEGTFKILLRVYWNYLIFWRKTFPALIKNQLRKVRDRAKEKILTFLSKILFRVSRSQAFIELNRSEKLEFKNIGTNSFIPSDSIVKNSRYISIGKNFVALKNFRIEAWDEYGIEGTGKFSPEIIIGDNVIFNTDVHIGCINKIVVEDNVMIASRVYISDHSHGNITKEELDIIASKRNLVSKGPVIIEKNVWIGEGVCILPGVTIGYNSVVGANAVVTKSFPPYSIIGGIPAKLIKSFQ